MTDTTPLSADDIETFLSTFPQGMGGLNEKMGVTLTEVSIERVVATKVVPARVLAERLRADSLRFLVFFSSVSARFGNRGQGDYAAANEALNKLADLLEQQFLACRRQPLGNRLGPDQVRQVDHIPLSTS